MTALFGCSHSERSQGTWHPDGPLSFEQLPPSVKCTITSPKELTVERPGLRFEKTLRGGASARIQRAAPCEQLTYYGINPVCTKQSTSTFFRSGLLLHSWHYMQDRTGKQNVAERVPGLHIDKMVPRLQRQ